jgi:hypothetical protein
MPRAAAHAANDDGVAIVDRVRHHLVLRFGVLSEAVRLARRSVAIAGAERVVADLRARLSTSDLPLLNSEDDVVGRTAEVSADRCLVVGYYRDSHRGLPAGRPVRPPKPLPTPPRPKRLPGADAWPG